MKFYKDNQNNIFAYESDGSQDHLINPSYVEITKTVVDETLKNKLDEEFNKLTYAEKRAQEYPDFKEYLDGVVKGDLVQQQNYIDACLAVKTKYPKPTL